MKNGCTSIISYVDLRGRCDAPGNFASKYGIAHKLDRDALNRLEIISKVQRAQEQAFDQADASRFCVLLELQALPFRRAVTVLLSCRRSMGCA